MKKVNILAAVLYVVWNANYKRKNNELMWIEKKYPNELIFFKQKFALDSNFEVRLMILTRIRLFLLILSIFLIVGQWKLMHGTLPIQIGQEGIVYISLMIVASVAAGIFFLTNYLEKKYDKKYHEEYVNLGRLRFNAS